MGRRLVTLVLCAFAASVTVGSVAEGRDPTLVGWWKCDEGEGTTARDSSGYGNDGVFTGAPTWVAGHFGQALEFDGTDDCLVCGNNPSLDLTTWTVAFWLNAAENKNYNGFVIKGADAAENYEVLGFADGSIHLPIMFDNGTRTYVNTATGLIIVGEWTHFAYMYDSTDGRRVFKDGALVFDDTETGTPQASTQPLVIANELSMSRFTHGAMDDIRIYSRVLTLDELSSVMLGKGPDIEKADKPSPANEAVDVPRDTALGWEAGEFAATHDVYFGTSFADVNEASRDNPMGVLAGQGQGDATFDPTGLEYGQTYYWRIDEVNAAPDNTIFKGETWSFTVEPFAYPLPGVTATASAFQAGMGPENTVNGSGLNDLGEHSTEASDMWMASGAMPVWIQFEFAKVQKLHEMWVWNSNQLIEGFLGFGAKDVTIEYSADGTTWTALEGVPQFSQASGTATYAANTTVNFGDVMAKFVKLTISSNWGGMAQQTGLAEVRFFYVPIQAFEPQPADGATGVSVETDLSWRPGREATSHAICIGTDSNAVADGTAPGAAITNHGYTPTDLLLATEYFWKVDEVGDAGTYAGDVWSFTTEEYAVVDDFESYTDDVDAEATIWHAWIDGLTDGNSGSQVGYDVAPFAERTIVHGGSQSMPLKYDNSSFAFSEATRTFDPPQDWTARGIKSLSLFFAGAAGNTGQLYIKIGNTKVAYDGDAADLARSTWQPWNIDLSTVGTNLIKVASLTIGVEGSGAAGTLYIDDIGLYPKLPEYIVPAEPESTNLAAHYTFDEGSGAKVGDSSGNGNHGTVNGNPQWVAGIRGGAMAFDGDGDFVDCGKGASLVIRDTITLACWIKVASFTRSWETILAMGDDSYRMSRSATTGNSVHFGCNGPTGDNLDATTIVTDDTWHHVALVYDGIDKIIYIDGVEDARAASTGQINASAYNLYIGENSQATGRYLQGVVDDVRIYSRPLSAAEVAGLAGLTTPRHKPF